MSYNQFLIKELGKVKRILQDRDLAASTRVELTEKHIEALILTMQGCELSSRLEFPVSAGLDTIARELKEYLSSEGTIELYVWWEVECLEMWEPGYAIAIASSLDEAIRIVSEEIEEVSGVELEKAKAELSSAVPSIHGSPTAIAIQAPS